MDRTAAWLLEPLQDPEAAAVLAVLATEGGAPRRLNDITALTALPTANVGRHLRTLERLRLAAYAAGAWRATERGVRHGSATAPAA